MTYVAMLSGSPSVESRTGHLLQHAERILRSRGLTTRRVDVRSLPPHALVLADGLNDSIGEAVDVVGQARAVVIATPVYNAAYSGLLKTFLDLLPRTVFAGKPVLALAAGGSPGYMLTLDYALKPVLSALGARDQFPGVFASDSDIPKVEGYYELTSPVAARLSDAVALLASALTGSFVKESGEFGNPATDMAQKPETVLAKE